MSRPKIGITTNIFYSKEKNFENYRYSSVSDCPISSVAHSGGIPCTIPMYETNAEIILEHVSCFDGLIFTGGQDVNPKLWNAEPTKILKQQCHIRDAFEITLLDAAVKLKKPILAICRGCQLLNVYFGGTLYQDIFIEARAKIAHVQNAHFDESTHKVKIKKSSITKEIFGNEIWVNSYHHMAVKKLANEFICTGKSSDGIIELFESKGKHFMLGVQWHPEMLYKTDPKMKSLFDLFLEYCK